MVRVVWVLFLVGCSAPVLKVKSLGDEHEVGYYTAEGGVVIEGSDNICVAPPAQAARAISGEGSGNVEVGKGDVTIDVGGSGTRQHEVEKLHDLQTSMLFMQHGLYRLCEARVNGFLPEKLDPAIRDAALAYFDEETLGAEKGQLASELARNTAYILLFMRVIQGAETLAEKEALIAQARASRGSTEAQGPEETEEDNQAGE